MGKKGEGDMIQFLAISFVIVSVLSALSAFIFFSFLASKVLDMEKKLKDLGDDHAALSIEVDKIRDDYVRSI